MADPTTARTIEAEVLESKVVDESLLRQLLQRAGRSIAGEAKVPGHISGKAIPVRRVPREVSPPPPELIQRRIRIVQAETMGNLYQAAAWIEKHVSNGDLLGMGPDRTGLGNCTDQQAEDPRSNPKAHRCHLPADPVPLSHRQRPARFFRS